MEILNQSKDGLIAYTLKQLENFFPDNKSNNFHSLINQHIDITLDRLCLCINSVTMWKENEFNYLHSSQYCQYLYFLANTIWKNANANEICTKLFMLNKALNGIDLFYEIEMPDIFFIGHSVGIVLAKAKYGDFFAVYQNSTVGKNHGIAPEIGKGVLLYPNSSVIGSCKVDDYTVISQGTRVINSNTSKRSIVFNGEQGKLIEKNQKKLIISEIFRGI